MANKAISAAACVLLGAAAILSSCDDGDTAAKAGAQTATAKAQAARSRAEAYFNAHPRQFVCVSAGKGIDEGMAVLLASRLFARKDTTLTLIASENDSLADVVKSIATAERLVALPFLKPEFILALDSGGKRTFTRFRLGNRPALSRLGKDGAFPDMDFCVPSGGFLVEPFDLVVGKDGFYVSGRLGDKLGAEALRRTFHYQADICAMADSRLSVRVHPGQDSKAGALAEILDNMQTVAAIGLMLKDDTVDIPAPANPGASPAGSLSADPFPLDGDDMGWGGTGVFLSEEAPTDTGLADAPPIESGTFMGDPRRDSTALVGTFYDLGTLREGEQADANADAREIIRNYLGKNWPTSLLNKYHQPRTRLYSPVFYMPPMPARYAAYAFQCGDKADIPAGVAVYRGMVKAPESGRFRFVGGGDTMLAVNFNRETVLEWGYEVPSYGISAKDSPHGTRYRQGLAQMQKDGYGGLVRSGDAAGAYKGFNEEIGLIEGPPFTVEEGKAYPIEILVAGFGRENMSFYLLIEKLPDEDGATTGNGPRRLFRTNKDTTDSKSLLDILKRDNRKVREPFAPEWTEGTLPGPAFDGAPSVWEVLD